MKKLSNSKLIIIILPAIIIILAAATLLYIKHQTFPFISMTYISNPDIFNADPGNNWKLPSKNLKIPISSNIKKSIISLINITEKDKNNIFKVCSKISKFTRSKLCNRYNIVDNINTVINSKTPYPGICSGYAKIAAAAAQAEGFPSRVIWMLHHSVVEIYFENYGWVLLDPHVNVIYKNTEGKFGSVLDIISDYDSYKAVELYRSPGGDDKLYKKTNFDKILPANPIIVWLDGHELFGFEKKMHSPVELIKYVSGIDLVKGYQYTGHITETGQLGNNRQLIRTFLCTEIILSIILFLFIKQYLKKKTKTY